MTSRAMTGPLRFVLVGPPACGSSVLADALSRLPRTTVHKDAFSPVPDCRVRAHTAYFGFPDTGYFRDEDGNAEHYLLRLLNEPRYAEQRLGVRLDTRLVRQHQLQEFVRDQYLQGDFVMVVVRRNPAVCYVSVCQGQTSCPVRIEPDELTTFVRDHLAVEQALMRACPDCLVVEYLDLCRHFAHQVRRAASFLECAEGAIRVPRPCRRTRPQRPLVDRVWNWERLYQSVPPDVREWLDDAGHCA